MVKVLESLGDRMVRLVAPSVSADAACGSVVYDSCVTGLCVLPWQDKIRYRQTCCSNGVCVTTYTFGSCGGCAA